MNPNPQFQFQEDATPLAVHGLSCESDESPIGIEAARPCFSWKILAEGRGQFQSAYQILAASSPKRLECLDADLWDSGKVASDQSVQIPYAGTALQSRQRCYWKVRAWDRWNRVSGFSPAAFWEMGLLSQDDWMAEWIGHPASATDRALYFRREFNLSDPWDSARVYVAGLGYHELYVNDRKVGDHVLDTAWTAYDKRILYVTHDVGHLLKPGANMIGAIAGNGWHGMPKLRLQLEIHHLNGTLEQIGTQGGHSKEPHVWIVGTGPVLRNSVYGGERYDARLEQVFTEQNGFAVAFPVEPPGGTMVSQKCEPIRVVETRTPERFWEARRGRFVFDCGQNLTGWAALRVAGARGRRVTLRFAETLRPDGTVNQANLRSADATDEYILKGGDTEHWEPRFTYHGFRYIQVEGFPGRPEQDSLLIKVVRSDLRRAGRFRCGNDMLNRIEEAIVRTEESNLCGVPTDCPQRDERLGWLNDMTVRAEEMIFHFDAARFLAKWCDDISDTQGIDGSITDTAPFKWGKRPADPVSVCYLEIPWLCYLHYGNVRLIEKHYVGMSRWASFLRTQAREGILAYSHWGDWAPPSAFAIPDSIGAGALSLSTPGELVSTGFLFHHARLLSKMAGVLGFDRDVREWAAYAKTVKQAFNERFWRENFGGYGSNNQACNALALHLRLVPEDRVARVLESLVKDVEFHNGHLTTGNICTKYLLESLSEHGRADIAYRIVSQESYPGWGYMLANGATTLWERWEHRTVGGMNSHNHPMLGSIAAWFFKYLGGISPDEDHPGFRRFAVKPTPIAELNFAEALYESPNGAIKSSWRRSDDGISFQISIPPNTQAMIYLSARTTDTVLEAGLPAAEATGVRSFSPRDGGVVLEVESGEYDFLVQKRLAESVNPAERESVKEIQDSPTIFSGQLA